MDAGDIAQDCECEDLQIKEEPVYHDENVTNYCTNDEIDDDELIQKSVSANGGYSYFIEENKCEIDFKEEVESECEELPLYDESDNLNFVSEVNQHAENEATFLKDPLSFSHVLVNEEDNVQSDRNVVKRKKNRLGLPFQSDRNVGVVKRKKKRLGRQRQHRLFSYAAEDPEIRRRNRSPVAPINVSVARRRNVECTVCASKFVHEGNLRRHMLTHASDYVLRFPCDLCSLAFVTKYLLDRHMTSHGLRPYACDECAMDFREKRHLIAHKKSHSEERPFICGICQTSFKFKNVLKTHMIVHLDEDSRFIASFNCTMCPQSFARRSQLKKHIRAHAYQAYDFALCKPRF